MSYLSRTDLTDACTHEAEMLILVQSSTSVVIYQKKIVPSILFYK